MGIKKNMATCSRSPLQLFLSSPTPRLICTRHVQAKSAESSQLYPQILSSRTANSKSAKKRVLLEFFEQVRTAEPQEKIRALTRVQRMKYVVYPQTPAIGADKWYQHFTKTSYLQGLPENLSSVEIENAAVSELSSLVTNALLQEHWYTKKGRTFIQKEQEKFVAPFVTNAVSGLISSLAGRNPALQLSSLGKCYHHHHHDSLYISFIQQCTEILGLFWLQICLLMSTFTGWMEKGLFLEDTGVVELNHRGSRLMTDLTVRYASDGSYLRYSFTKDFRPFDNAEPHTLSTPV